MNTLAYTFIVAFMGYVPIDFDSDVIVPHDRAEYCAYVNSFCVVSFPVDRGCYLTGISYLASDGAGSLRGIIVILKQYWFLGRFTFT